MAKTRIRAVTVHSTAESKRQAAEIRREFLAKRKAEMSNAVKPKHAGGRPTVMTESTLNKLNEAFAFGASDQEACFYADITQQTLIKYQAKHPEFVERKLLLRERPTLVARQAVLESIQRGDGHLGLKYLERKRRQEFSLQMDIVSDGEKINFGNSVPRPEETK